MLKKANHFEVPHISTVEASGLVLIEAGQEWIQSFRCNQCVFGYPKSSALFTCITLLGKNKSMFRATISVRKVCYGGSSFFLLSSHDILEYIVKLWQHGQCSDSLIWTLALYTINEYNSFLTPVIQFTAIKLLKK